MQGSQNANSAGAMPNGPAEGPPDASTPPFVKAADASKPRRDARPGWLDHGSVRIPTGFIEGVRTILLSKDPARFRKAFECATGKAFRCLEIIRQTETCLVCMAKRIDIEYDSFPVRATMTVDLDRCNVRSILLERMD